MYSNQLKKKISKLFRVGLTIKEVSTVYPEISKSSLYRIKKMSDKEEIINGKSCYFIEIIKNNAVELLKVKYVCNDSKVKIFMPIYGMKNKKMYTKKEVLQLKWINKMLNEKRLTLNSIIAVRKNLQKCPSQFQINSNITMARIYQYFGLDIISIDMLESYKEKTELEEEKQKIEEILKKIKNNEDIQLPIIKRLDCEDINRNGEIISEISDKDKNEQIKNDKQIINDIRKSIYNHSINIDNLDIIKEKLSSIRDKTLAVILLSEIYENLGLNDLRKM